MNTCEILINRGLTGLLMFSLLVPAFGSLADDSDNLQNQLSDVQSQMNQQLQKRTMQTPPSVIFLKNFASSKRIWIRLEMNTKIFRTNYSKQKIKYRKRKLI